MLRLTTETLYEASMVAEQSLTSLGESVEELLRAETINATRTAKLEEEVKTLIGTPTYCAPEALTAKGMTAASDLWSLGLCLFAIPASARGQTHCRRVMLIHA